MWNNAEIIKLMIDKQLSRNGFVYRCCCHQSPCSWCNGTRVVGTVADIDDELIETIPRAVTLLKEMKLVKTSSAMASSYALKHTLEREWRKRDPNHRTGGYMANGDVIVAAYLMGVRVIYDGNGPNCLIGVSHRHKFG